MDGPRKPVAPKARKSSTASKGPAKASSPAEEISGRLQALYPVVRCALNYESPLQLLVATILSAQCTDVRVNMVTPALFARFPDAKAFAQAEQEEVEKLIQSTGFFRNKATNIIACCKALVEKHKGQVPRTLEELTPLGGVGRKTANVVLGNAYGIPGITVDTHVGRLSRRMGLTQNDDPVKVEKDLMEQLAPSDWTLFSLRMIEHGRKVCDARKPQCGLCTLADLCPKTGVETLSLPKELKNKKKPPRPR